MNDLGRDTLHAEFRKDANVEYRYLLLRPLNIQTPYRHSVGQDHIVRRSLIIGAVMIILRLVLMLYKGPLHRIVPRDERKLDRPARGIDREQEFAVFVSHRPQ